MPPKSMKRVRTPSSDQTSNQVIALDTDAIAKILHEQMEAYTAETTEKLAKVMKDCVKKTDEHIAASIETTKKMTKGCEETYKNMTKECEAMAKECGKFSGERMTEMAQECVAKVNAELMLAS